MREGHLDIFDRSKSIFIQSLYDNIGKADAGAEYYFNALNLQRNGYILSPEDESLFKMVDSIIKQDEFIDSLQSNSLGEGYGILPDPSYDTSRVQRPQPGQPFTGANIQLNPGDPNTDSHHDIDYFNSHMFPLHGKMGNVISDFYLPQEAGVDSQSQKDAPKENHFDEKHTSSEHDEYASSNFMVNHAHYHKLDADMTNHDIYDRHYGKWRDSNDAKVSQITANMHEQGIYDETIINHELRKLHMDEAKQGWAKNLTFTDYLLGLEWLKPEQRHEVYDYLSKNGISQMHNLLKLEGGSDWRGRLVRNFHQRFAPVYNHWIGESEMPGFAVAAQSKREPSDAKKIGVQENRDAFSAVPNGYQRAVDFWKSKTGSKQSTAGQNPSLHTGIDGVRTLQFNPLKGGHRFSEKRASGGGSGGNFREGEVLGMDFKTMQVMLGIDNNNRLHQAGQHPLYRDEWHPDESPFTQEEIDKILRKRQELTKEIYAARIGKNEGGIHYNTFQDKDSHDSQYTEDGQSYDTLSTHWQRPFFGKGGLAKHPNLLFDKLHNATILYGKNHFGAQRPKEDATESDDIYQNLDFQQLRSTDDLEEEFSNDPYHDKFHPENITTDGKDHEHSLWFKKDSQGNRIMPRTDEFADDDDGRDFLEFSMKSFLAPFASRPAELMDSQFGEEKFVDRGGPLNSINNLSPNQANRIKIGIASQGNTHVERHAQTVAPAYSNQLTREHEEEMFAREDARAIKIRSKLQGNISGGLETYNRFSHKGGIHDPRRQLQRAGRNAYSISHFLNLHGPPGSPIALDSPEKGQHPLAGGERAFLPLTLPLDSQDGMVDTNMSSELRAKHTQESERLENTIDKLEQKLLTALPNEKWALEDLINANEQRLAELDEKMERDYPQVEAKPYGGNVPLSIKSRNEKLVSDDKALAKVAKMWAPQFPQLFDRSLPPDVLEGNVRQFARMMNDFLHTAPHEMHGIRTLSPNQGVNENDLSRSNPLAESAKDFAHNSDVTFNLNDFGKAGGNLDNYLPQIADKLGMNYDDFHTKQTLSHFFNSVAVPSWQNALNAGLDDFPVPIQSVGNWAKSHFPELSDIDLNHHFNLMRQPRGFAQGENKKITIAYNNIETALFPHDTGMGRNVKYGIGDRNDILGLGIHASVTPDERAHDEFKSQLEELQRRTGHNESRGLRGDVSSAIKQKYIELREKMQKVFKFKGIKEAGVGDKRRRIRDRSYRHQHVFDSLIYSDPAIEPTSAPASLPTFEHNFDEQPIEPFGPDAKATPYSLHNSSGYMHEFGWNVPFTFDYHIGRDGKIEIIPFSEPKRDRLTQPTRKFWGALGMQDVLYGTDWKQYNIAEHQPPQFKHGRNEDNTFGKSEFNLATLTNPDIIRKELGKSVPLLQPMHRIFEIGDLEHLRGFTGDWIVSVMPEGERGFVKKEDDEVSSTNFTLSDEDKENFKKVTDEDYHLDVIKIEDGYYIFDVIKFDDKEVYDVVLSDRIKVLRGGMEGVENIHVPSASDTRLTDDAGLELTVENLQKEHDRLLLRDAKSTYMVGEMRHPKWVLLSPGSDVVVRVLERRGNGPYTYRLGTGPITQDDDLGSRAVESDGEMYMDLGAAFDSPEKYNEGDHVKVNVSNVAESETADGNKLYTVSGTDIQEEAEGEGLVSQETLSLLTKSENSQWLCEVYRVGSGVRISMPQGDVVYKCTQSSTNWTVHSPLASSSYLIRMSESQRPYWAPVAGALLKAGVEITEKEAIHESEGEAEPLIEPKKVKDTEWWDEENKKKVLVKGMNLLEKLLKSGVGSVGQSSTGAMGLGIGYATPIESPTGPTNLHDSKTMPDYDVRDMEKDFSIDPSNGKQKTPKRMTVPTEEGVLEITEDSAVFRT